MKERTLLKTALICTILGIFVLYILTENIKLEETPIHKAKLMENSIFRIKGTVERVINKEGLTIVTISKKESIDVVVFENFDANEGDFVDVVGEIKDYKGKKELIADEFY